MSVNDAITVGAGPYPWISVMVEWKGGLEDTLMTRSQLHNIAGKKQVDEDLLSHLPYHEMFKFERRKVCIMTQTEAGLSKGKKKAIQRIKDDQLKAAQAKQA